ncbi:TetR/AcrR family transcriptional regulator [Enterocloster citroniae]|uniref:TetR/AcrR family transcriptional regulator n=1 Tax=Enterocloster citroniae TaxID=358743 RepID=UPI000A8F8040|nr:TetR/AcrR family transcriptional regulator [Enterocloster citroniae]
MFHNNVLDHPEGDVDSHIDGCAKICIRGVSLRSIARRARTSTGSIYTRLGDKHGLFLALVYHSVKELLIWCIPPKGRQNGG